LVCKETHKRNSGYLDYKHLDCRVKTPVNNGRKGFHEEVEARACVVEPKS
jgi:hypothetical protein